ncbi:MAG TPA: tannase/feruloyl esterase family alpha/beta hydrolase [Terriglobales bacterium]|jgi:feruloyl esterase
MGAVILVLTACLATAAPAAAASCGQLAQLAPPNVTVASAQLLHQVILPYGPPLAVPAFCRVIAVATPAAGSRIGIEVWIPAAGWDGRLEGVGNGGYASSMDYGAMIAALRRGSAVAATDTGHTGANLDFVVGHPESINDWGHRAVHVMTEFAKLAVRDLEGRFPDYSYFDSCSTGGGQALSEAQRYPGDYDGILAGDPGNDRVNLNTAFLWAYVVDHRVPGQEITGDQLQLLQAAAVRACDRDDGVADGIISEPLRCHFDPATLVCKGSSTAACLTPAQVATAKAIYAGPSFDGKSIYPGFEPGSEAVPGTARGGWSSYLTDKSEPVRVDFWKYWVFNDPAWDWHTFDFNRDVTYANAKLAAVNSVNPDLRAFARHGGKLLLYHGWADPVVPPRSTIQYVERVNAVMGSAGAAQVVRLFLVPGMGHCSGGYGPLPDGNRPPPGRGRGAAQPAPASASTLPEPNPKSDFLGALEYWREKGVAPTQVMGSQTLSTGRTRTRPVCAYPKVARWNGHGSSDNAVNFACAQEAVH